MEQVTREALEEAKRIMVLEDRDRFLYCLDPGTIIQSIAVMENDELSSRELFAAKINTIGVMEEPLSMGSTKKLEDFIVEKKLKLDLGNSFLENIKTSLPDDYGIELRLSDFGTIQHVMLISVSRSIYCTLF